MTPGQKFAIGTIVSGLILLAISRSDAKAVTGNGTPSDKSPPRAPTPRPTETTPAPVLQVSADIATYTNDSATLERVIARMSMELDALGAPADYADTVRRATRYLSTKGVTVPGTLDLTTPGPLTIWAARKVDEEVRRRFYS